jgi:hypothetical protein
MTPTLRERLVRGSLAGRFDVLLGVGGGLAVLGLVLFVWALVDGHADRAWQLFHVNWLYFTSLSAGAVAFVAVQKITNAKWSGVIIRFASAQVAFLPVALLGLLLIFTLGYGAVFGPMQAALPELQHSKVIWLSRPFMFLRQFLGLGLLAVVGWRLVRSDMIPDLLAVRGAASPGRRALYDRLSRNYDGSVEAALRLEDRIHGLAPKFAVIYAIVLTLTAFDCVMALQPHWYSNLFGAYFFMGAFLAAHMALALLMIHGAGHLGVADLVSPKQRHDLGKLCFGFTVFWTYLMWAQFLVIWYGNLPEETGFVFARLWGHWLPIGEAVLIGMFIVPFFGLLGVAPKKIRPIFAFFALVSLVAFWLERYLLVMPSVSALPGPVFLRPEWGPTLLFLGLYLVTYALYARTFPMISPRLAEITLERERGHTFSEYDHEERPADYVAPEAMERRERPRA